MCPISYSLQWTGICSVNCRYSSSDGLKVLENQQSILNKLSHKIVSDRERVHIDKYLFQIKKKKSGATKCVYITLISIL